MIRIYDFAGGARGLRAYWTCEELGVSYETVEVSFPPSKEYRQLNSLGTVPYLEDGDVSMGESVAMMLYLAERYGPTSLLPPPDTADLAAVLQFTLLGEASLAAPMNTLLAARYGAPDADKNNWSVRVAESQIERQLTYLSDRIGEGSFLVGGTISLADISIVTALLIWRHGLSKSLPAQLEAYVTRLTQRGACVRARAALPRT